MAMKIVFGGFQHETNTFAPTQATLRDFEQGGGFPGLCSGATVFERIRGADIPAAGFVELAAQAGCDLIPTSWAAASPSAHVTNEAYDHISGLILSGIEAALPVDAVYLDLHGAMVTERLDDAEGDILRRVRSLVGPDVPVVASLDLHANVTRAMLETADFLVAYRTYPHVDKAETGRRAFRFLQQLESGMPRQALAVRKIPFLIPICWQSTFMQPARRLYDQLADLETAEGVSSLSFAMGFPAADFPECGALVWAYGANQSAADRAADDLAGAVIAAEGEFTGKLYTADEAVAYAMAAASSGHPIVIADAQDNPGAGGTSDTTGVLAALIRHDAQDAAIGLIVDAPAATRACAAGVGARIRLAIGGHYDVGGGGPLEAEFTVEAVSDGEFDATGPYYAGFHMHLGPSACLRVGGVRVVLASEKVQMADQAMFRYVGIEPTRQRILVVKSSNHFRADFTPIAHEIIVCAAPGAMPMNPTQMPWTRLPADLRLFPKGPTFAAFAADRGR